MANKQFTPEIIIAIREKYPDQPLFKADFENVRTVIKNKKITTYFVPTQFKTLDNKWAPMNLAFVNQIIASNANPPKTSEEKDIKHVQIMFRELTEEDLAVTDYEVSKRAALLKHNKNLTTAYAILAYEYISMVHREIIPEGKKKNGKIKFIQGNKKIHSFMQTHRELQDGESSLESDENTDAADQENKDDDKEDEHSNKIALPTPLYRLKLKAVKETKKIGYETEKGHVYTVFDMQKTNKEHKAGNNVKVPAKIKSNGQMIDLDVFNAKRFITYMSLTAGILSMDSVCLSSMGISMMNAFRELGVWKHRTLKQETFNTDVLNALTEFGIENEEEDIDLGEDSDKSNTKYKFDKKATLSANVDKALDDDEELNNLDEPEDQTEETQQEEPVEQESTEEPTEVPKKKTTRGRGKKA
jgi:hypothetical protein